MVLNVGIISACVLYKNRPGAQTRLQKLQRKLKDKPISQKTLYSHPIKKIFSIVMILCFMLGLVVFLKEIERELKEMNKEVVKQVVSREQINFQPLFPYRPMKLLDTLLKTPGNRTSPTLMNSITNHHQYLKVQKTVYWLLIFFTIPLVVLSCSLQFQRVIVKSRSLQDPNQVSGHIFKQRFHLLSGWKNVNESICKVDDSIVIQLCGQERFSNTNYFYAIKKISKVQNPQETQTKSSQQDGSVQVNEENAHRIHEQIIMQKGSIYEARQALIYLCHVLKKDINLSIKNGPVKKSKSKKARSLKKTKKEQ